MFWTIIATSLLAVQAHAGNPVERGMAEAAILAGRSSGLETSMQNLDRRMPVDTVSDNMPRYASEAESDGIEYAKRATDNTTGTTDIGNGVVLNADGTINMTAWDTTATAACNTALAKLAVSSNPSGTCTCYNLPALNNVTGAFEADLRLFQISTPRDSFAGISAENIQVGLSYSGASVSPVSVATASKLVVGRAADTANTTTTTTTTTGGLKMLQQYLFVGQINKDLLTTDLTMAQLEALVMPLVTLTGTNAAGTTVATNVSSNEAAFVTGVFSDMVVMSNTTKAQVAVDDVVAALSNRTVAFVVPGVQIILFPIGLVITSVWLAIGVTVIGMGFVQRVGFRESYRTRAMQSVKGGAGRI